MASKNELASDLLVARTDGRTNGRTTHQFEIPQVPKRAGDFECPESHRHTDNCYKKHGCRCVTCKADHSRAQLKYWRDHPEKHRPPDKPKPFRNLCRCGCGTLVARAWVHGHNKRDPEIHPAGMTFARALEIAQGATPRERW